MNYFELYCLVLSLITFEAYGYPQDLRDVAQAVKETEHNYYHSEVSGYCVIKAYTALNVLSMFACRLGY
jgi:hypothetical protein